MSSERANAEWLARNRIMELRRMYGLATDLIGSGDASKVKEGEAIYEEIFTPAGARAREGRGPAGARPRAPRAPRERPPAGFQYR